MCSPLITRNEFIQIEKLTKINKKTKLSSLSSSEINNKYHIFLLKLFSPWYFFSSAQKRRFSRRQPKCDVLRSCYGVPKKISKKDFLLKLRTVIKLVGVPKLYYKQLFESVFMLNVQELSILSDIAPNVNIKRFSLTSVYLFLFQQK
jgi:hypothetical protein